MKINPNDFILGGIAGAAFGTVICHIITSFIGFIQIKKYINLKMNFIDYVLKPIIATFTMIIFFSSIAVI